MKRTDKYDLGIFEEGDLSLAVPEYQRWITLDTQLYSLYKILGNGIISGWDLIASSGLSVAVASGSGHVNFVAVETEDNTTISNLTASSRNYIYASLTLTSYWDQSVSFEAVLSLSLEQSTDSLYLGYVDTDASVVTDINMDNRTTLGFLQLVQTLVKNHKHIGGTTNPSPVNLNTDVQGLINQRNLPDLDASIIQTGTIDDDRLPKISHITGLTNQGSLTHPQLDSFVEALSLTNPALMGEASTVNLLQLILALKHVYPDIDEYLVNEVAFIPGISPDSYVDWDNTTADVDTKPWSEGGQHTITGGAASGKQVYTKTWDTETEFSSGTYSQVYIDGDSVTLETEETTQNVEVFTTTDDWEVITQDLSSISDDLTLDPTTYVTPPASAKLTIGDTQTEIALVIRKQFDAQDWSGYKYLYFYLKTTSVEHGDVFFYIKDTVYGTQNSYTKVLSRNTATVNIDTLQNGWQQMVVDISAYSKSNISEIGFYISSQDGWDTSKGLILNIDKIYLSTGNEYKEDGYFRVVYGTGFPYEFWRVRWDALIPTDADSAGLVLKSRTRVGNTLADLSTASWSSYSAVNGYEIQLPSSNLYAYIEVEMFFEASTTLNRSATVNKLYLDFYANDTEDSFNYDDQDDWESGNLFNIDTKTTVNSMLIAKTEEVDDIFYGTNGSAVQLDDDLAQLYEITGSMLPISTYQALNSLAPSLGHVSGVSRGSQGNVWMADTENDRVLELDKSGNLITAFYGSFLTTPNDPYGVEDSGPGSNIVSTPLTTTTTTTQVYSDTLDVLHSFYNSEAGKLYVVFNKNLENIYNTNNQFEIDRFYLKIGTQRVYLSTSTVTLWGIDNTKYNNWYALTTSTDPSAQLITQFNFDSHVLVFTLNGSDKTALNHLTNTEAPSVWIITPEEQERKTSNVTVKFLTANFEVGSVVGDNFIRVSIDGGASQDLYGTSVTYNGLGDGVHVIHAQLIDGDGTANTNIEAIADGSFVVYTGTYNAPYIHITSPKPNQIYSASTITVDFEVENFSVLPTGQHLRYKVDSGTPTDHYSLDSITIEDVAAGKHTVEVYMVDKDGNSYGYTYGSATVNFIVGLNSLAVVKLYVDKEAIYDSTGKITNDYIRDYVSVSNIYVANIYSPIDVQVIPVDTSKVNPSGLPTVLVSKLRSPSTTYGLASSNTAYIAGLAKKAADTTFDTSTLDTLIYGTYYLDGHSVVQIDLTGNTIFSNNAAVFADSKTNAITLLGSGEKLGDNEIIIADSYNKRAIITYTDLDTQLPKIEWQYDSDRNIPDFHIILQDNITINVNNDAISETDVFIRQGTLIIWKNNSASPISVYSGKTDFDQFQLDPDLTLYGSEFHSTTLQPGERYTFKFVTVGEFNYFIYPNILLGKITVTRNRISSRDQFLVLESDNLESPFTSRVMKLDSWGNVLWQMGDAYLVKPRDCRPLLNGGAIISV